MNKNKSYIWVELLIVLLLFASLGTFRAQDAFNEGMTLAFPGDGQATIGWYAEYIRVINNNGLLEIFGDRFYPSFGGGFHKPQPVAFFWKSLIYLLSFLDVDNIYDVSVVIIFSINGVAAYLLFRYLNIHSMLSFLGALLINLFENFDARVVGHLGLCAYFGFIFSIIVLLHVTKHHSDNIKYNILLGSTLAFSFSINEYYGFFMLEIGAVYYLIYVWKNIGFVKTIKNGLICLSSFFIMMGFIFPTTLYGPILAKFNLIEGFPSRELTKLDYLLFALHDPLEVFISNQHLFESVNKWIKEINYFGQHGGELTFRFGFYILFIFGLSLLINYIVLSKWKFHKLLITISPWFVLMFLTVMLSIHPDHPLIGNFSFIHINMKFAWMLRVSTRVLVLAFVFMVVILLLTMNQLLTELKQRNSKKSIYVLTLILMLFPFRLILADTRYDSFAPWSKWGITPMQETTKLAKHLKYLADGVVLEVPFYDQAHLAESSYSYLINAAYHGKQFLNFLHPTEKDLGVPFFAQKVNQGELSIDEMSKIGIKYIIVWESYHSLPYASQIDYSSDYWKKLNGIRKIHQGFGGTIYQVVDSTNYNKSFYKEIIKNTPKKIIYNAKQLYLDNPLQREITKNHEIDFHTKSNDLGRYLVYGPYHYLDKGKYKISYEFEVEQMPAGDTCILIDAVAKKQGLLFESYVQINSSGILSVHGDLTLNSIDRIEVRVAPLCLGDLRLKQIVLKRG